MRLVKSLLPHRGVQAPRTHTRREGPVRGARIRRWAALPACAVLMLAGVASAPAAADEEHVYCVMGDIAGETRYYSAVFLADYSGTVGIKNDFRDWLDESGKDPSALDAWCFYEDTYRAAERNVDRRMRDHRRSFRVVSTRWAPDSFTAQPLRDFHIEVSSRRREVRVCMRDHECEDGDRVRVSVNGARVLSGEIDNDWDCEDVRVSEGRNRVELYAVNGSGNKGNCSYADVNTGELRVEGRNMETQSWRHRGGAGSSANIIVEVD